MTAGMLTPLEKTEKLANIRAYHKKLLEQYEIPEKDFNMKTVWSSSGKKVVGLFPNEFTKDKGFYMEFIDGYLEPTDPKRKVYRMPCTPNYEHVYTLSPKGTYIVPITDLEEVDAIGVDKLVEKYTFDSNKSLEETDELIDKLTIRDLAAILWKKEVSSKSWLNQLIGGIK